MNAAPLISLALGFLAVGASDGLVVETALGALVALQAWSLARLVGLGERVARLEGRGTHDQ